jgi:hypothetical protein
VPNNSSLVSKALVYVRTCLLRYGFVLKTLRTDAGRVENANDTMLSPFLDNSFCGMALLAWIRTWNYRPSEASREYTLEFALTGHHPDVVAQFRASSPTRTVWWTPLLMSCCRHPSHL